MSMAVSGTLANSAVLEEPGQPREPTRQPGFLRHIQGLRAVAVGLVVATHLTGWPAGGFIGVFSYGGMPHELARENMSLFAQTVLPRLKAVDVGSDVGLAMAA